MTYNSSKAHLNKDICEAGLAALPLDRLLYIRYTLSMRKKERVKISKTVENANSTFKHRQTKAVAKSKKKGEL